ncbi:MAG: hypothetical protein Q8R61_00300 [Thiobacillus sp.]|uniref:hypothetical protein n=1 Tax=Thiobacillus sp. TaxID=924 RepID=UPI00273365AF|nr:hypothetical protein [Thiobacillus sp.]MDP3583541.1 hypothetical protein [Thiobacillus sp.]
MGVAGLIVLYVALKFLAIWSAFSGLALGASVLAARFPRRSGNTLPQPQKIIAAVLIFALQVFGAGITTLILGVVLSTQIDDRKILNALTGGLFLLMCLLLAQRQVWKLFKLPFWQPHLLKLPLGVTSQLFLVMVFLSGFWLNSKMWPERHESQRTATPNDQFSARVETIRLRPSNVWLSIPSNHIGSIREDYLPKYMQTFSSRMQTEVTVEFLFPDYANRNLENEQAFKNLGNRDRLNIRIKSSAVRQGLSLKKEWEIQTGLDTNSSPAVEAGQMALEASGGRRNVLATYDDVMQLTTYSTEGRVWKWFVSGEHVIRCMNKASSVSLIGQPCDVEKDLPNGVSLMYTFPFSRLSQWKEIDDFVQKTYASYNRVSKTH